MLNNCPNVIAKPMAPKAPTLRSIGPASMAPANAPIPPQLITSPAAAGESSMAVSMVAM
jgi:hypothetical protein